LVAALAFAEVNGEAASKTAKKVAASGCFWPNESCECYGITEEEIHSLSKESI
jgi:hypothetical protein